MATILGSHSEIHTIPNETAVFCGTDSMAQIHRFLQQSNPHRNHRKAIICEKTPSHVHHIGKIRTYFPDAKIVLMVRDGRDVVASLKHHAGSVTHAINRWVHDTAATLAAAATTNVKMIKYESLVDDPVAVVSEICAFIGVPFQQQMLRFHGDAPDWFGVTERKAGPVAEGGDRRTLRNWQVHQPLFDGRGKWRGQLGGDDLAQFSLAAGALMAELGYEGSANCDIDMACRSDGSGTQPTDGPSPCETGTKPNDEATDETLPDASQAVQRLFVEAFEHHREGRLNQAEALYQQVLAIDFRHADSRHLSGVLAYQTGRHDLAVEAIRMAISLDDKIALYHCNLGNALWQLRRLDEAVTCYQSALDLTPHYPEAHNNLGAAFKEQGRLHHAIICYCTAIDLKPDYASAHANLGNAFVELGRLDGAAACYQRVLSLVPDDLGAHLGLANVLREQGRLETAIIWYQRALNLKADMPEAHLGLGNALREQGRLEEAIACYRHALDLKPAYPEAHNNLGVTVKQLGRLEEASACYGRALGLGLDIPEAHHNLAIALLTRGDMALGWREYEWRWKTPQMADARRDFAQPQWRGETVEGRTLLIHAEQGYGDTLQFCRYATLAAARGARVIMQVPGPLVRLLGELPGVGLVVEEGQTLPAFDLHCPMLRACHWRWEPPSRRFQARHPICAPARRRPQPGGHASPRWLFRGLASVWPGRAIRALIRQRWQPLTGGDHWLRGSCRRCSICPDRTSSACKRRGPRHRQTCG